MRSNSKISYRPTSGNAPDFVSPLDELGRLQPARRDSTPHHQLEAESQLATRTSHIAGAFLLIVAVGAVLDSWYAPERFVAVLLTLALHLTVWGGVIYTLRVVPAWRFPVIVLSANLLSLSICGYYAWGAGSAEFCAVTLVLFLGGFALFGCRGLRGQMLCSVGTLVGYPAALLGGAVPALPIPYGVAATCTAVALSGLGAYLLDRLRFEVSRNHASEAPANEAILPFAETIFAELQPSLSAVAGYAKLFLRGGFGPATDRQFDAIRRMQLQSEQSLDLLDGILDFGHTASGAISFNTEEFRLGEVMEHLAERIPPAWRRPIVKLDWHVKGSHTAIHGDRRKLEMCLRTIIRTILTHTPEGTVIITTKPQFDAGQVQFSVSNAGSGVDASELAILRRLLSGHVGVSELSSRPGHGLDIVRCFATALGATVTIENEEGEGMRIILTLPLQPPRDQGPAPSCL